MNQGPGTVQTRRKSDSRPGGCRSGGDQRAGAERASLEPGLLHRKRGELWARSSAPPVRLRVQPPHTSPSLGTWNLVRSVTGAYVGYRLPERAPDRRTALRAHRGPLRARPRMSAPPPPRPAGRRARRAPLARPGGRRGVPAAPERSLVGAFPGRRAARGRGLSAGPRTGGGAGRQFLEELGAAGGRGDFGHPGGRPA